jgi:hypothetical protein
MTLANSSATTAPECSSARAALRLVLPFAAVVALLWLFPTVWYRGGADQDNFCWFAEQSDIKGWSFKDTPISKAAEAVLVGDRMVSGEFTREDGAKIRVFSAKRYSKKENEIGLFSHTPDRCWTAVGWRIEPTEPDVVERAIHGVRVLLERRIFSVNGQRELVYFGALVGGKALPYRLDQYYSAGRKRTEAGGGDTSATWLRLKQARVWSWAWDSFKNRTPLSGPQQFLRISTPVSGAETNAADELLTGFLEKWLAPADYSAELAQWKIARK